MIDGKIFHNRKIISGFRPSQIQSLDILSDSDAIALYGSQAKYGAIVIKLYTPVKHHVWKHAFWPWPKVLTIHRTGREYRRERRKQMRKGFIDWIE